MSQEEELLEFVQKYDLGIGETLSFKCPHCGKEVVVELKALGRTGRDRSLLGQKP
jgi:hypothetical protein